MLRYRAFTIGGWLSERLPLSLAYLLGALVGSLAYALNRRARRTVQANMRQVLGPAAGNAAVRTAARRCFRTATWYYTDLARTPLMRPERFIKERIKIRGLEHLLEAQQAGKGVICVSIHYGSPEYTAQCLGAAGIRFMALVEPLDPPEMAALFHRYRASQGQQFEEATLAGMKRVVRHLRTGGTLSMLIDRDIQGTGIEVPFLGKPARLPVGAADLARHTGATVLPFVTRRLGPDRYSAIIGAPISLGRSGNAQQDRSCNTARLIAWFEPYLRRDPSQWFVLQEPVWIADRAGRPARIPRSAPFT